MSKRSEAKTKNCTKCNKALKRISWYYRNGKYFCNKECFKSFQKEKQEEKSS